MRRDHGVSCILSKPCARMGRNIEGAKLIFEEKMAEIRGFLIQHEIQEEELGLSIENGQFNEFLSIQRRF